MSSPPEASASSSWVTDPDVVVFSGRGDMPFGATEQHGMSDALQHMFGKTKETVKDNWVQVVEQMRYLIAHADAMTENYELSEVEFQVGFSAEGTIVFIAQGGITATITATFKKK